MIYSPFNKSICCGIKYSVKIPHADPFLSRQNRDVRNFIKAPLSWRFEFYLNKCSSFIWKSIKSAKIWLIFKSCLKKAIFSKFCTFKHTHTNTQVVDQIWARWISIKTLFSFMNSGMKTLVVSTITCFISPLRAWVKQRLKYLTLFKTPKNC